MKNRIIIISTLLLATMIVAFALPKPKYVSPDIIGALTIPESLSDWRSKDMAGELNLTRDDRYNFIKSAFARLYGTREQKTLLFLLLDAGNFHHPKVCFGSSGYKLRELDDTTLTLPNRSIKAKTLLAQKDTGGFVIMYWMVINQTKVNWTEQKFQQLWYQLFNKEKIGVMGRLDIPIEGNDVQGAIKLAQKFIEDLSKELSDRDSEYIFGK